VVVTEFMLLAAAIAVATAAFIWTALSLAKVKMAVGAYNTRVEAIKKETERIFTDEFREELKNRGRLYFEKIINENAMFLKQDLGLTASQLNEYMQTSLKKVLDEEFDKYKVSINDAKEAALTAITKTRDDMEEQRSLMQKELEVQLTSEKARLVRQLDERLTQVANQYLLDVLAAEVDLSSQGDYIFSSLEAHKADLIKDVEDAV
jgi:F0F1-type ATP synthase membrane subunit b/b'